MKVAKEKVASKILSIVDKNTEAWGINVEAVELKDIELPESMVRTMAKQAEAEREKRAAILESEAIRQSQILEAEGRKQSQILRAEGDAKARILRADAEAKAVQTVAQAAEKYFKGNAQRLRSLEVAERVYAQNSKIIIPAGTDLITVLGEGNEKIIPIKKKA